MKYQKVQGTNYFVDSNYNSIINRLDKIQPNAERKWGQMSVAQMLHHLNLAIGSGLGYYNLPDESNFMGRTFSHFLIFKVLKRFFVGTPTGRLLKVTEEFNFETEKKLLKEILTRAYETKSDSDWGLHTYFGKMTREEWGSLIMIHCNHHFQQFGN
jgi:hypothetical protein